MKLTIVDGGGGGDGDRPQDRPRSGPCRIMVSDRIAPFLLDRRGFEDILKALEPLDRLLEDGWHLGMQVHQKGKSYEYETLTALRLGRHRGLCDRIVINAWGSVRENLEETPVSAAEAAHIRWHSDGRSLNLGLDLKAGCERSNVYCSAPTRRIADMLIDPVLAQLDRRMLDVVTDQVRFEASVEDEIERIRELFPDPPRPRRSDADMARARAWTAAAIASVAGIVVILLAERTGELWLPAIVALFVVLVASIMFRRVALVEHRDRSHDMFSDRVDEALDKVRRQCELDREIADMKVMCGIPDPSTRAASVIDIDA